ncbi:MAG: zinc ribbon domain-containing protein [Acidimicrobiales bacterium]
MASPAYEQILQVPAFDLNLSQLRHRHANHPLREELATASAGLAAAEVVAAEIEERKHVLDREQKRHSDDVELIDAKRTEIDGKLYDGSVTASKDLLALQDEAAALLARQRGIEDQELEIMEQLESVGGELATARMVIADADAAVTGATDALAAATAELDAEIEVVVGQRAEAAEPAPADLLARYEQLSTQFDGVAVARLENGACDGCHIQLSAVAIDRLSKASDDAVVTCEECGRLLVQ